MAIKRLVIVADEHNLESVCEALLQVGVKAKEIYVSKDQGTNAIKDMGINISLPSGKLKVSSYVCGRPSEMDYPGYISVP